MIEPPKFQRKSVVEAGVYTGNKKNLLDNCTNTLEIEGFSKLVNDKIRLRELMVTADFIVGDYRYVMFESALLDRPAYFSSFDHEKKQKDVNIISDFSVTQPFPIVRTSEELIQALEHIESYDYHFIRFEKNTLPTVTVMSARG